MEEKITPPPANSYSIPIAIVVAGLAIAGAIYFSNVQKVAIANQAAGNVVVDKITGDDHIVGNPNAKVIVVEYSDLECPFCKVFHQTMEQIMSDYGKDGQVAWVYREFPIASLHPKAHKESEAAECASKLGGNVKFWEFINHIFAITPSNNGLDPAELGKTAVSIGLDETAFNTCLNSGDMASLVDAGIASGNKAQVNGTPTSYIIVNGKVAGTIPGAQPYASVKAAIDQALK